MPTDTTELYKTATGAEGDVAAAEARNGLRHTLALSMTKVADGLIDPKLVLTWLAGALGAPAAVAGLLVPIREAGALLPQVLLAGRVQAARRRKWIWAAGSAGQAVAAAALAVVALTLDGLAAGVALCAALAVLAVSRAACSVSFKDVLGKTVAKTRRGAVTGTAGSVAALAVLVFAALLLSGLLTSVGVVAAAIALAAVLWALAAAVFTRLEEPASDPDRATPLDLRPLRDDAQLRRFVLVRAALTATALAPPYFVLLGGGQTALQGLGALMLASAGASFAGSYVWGRLADRSSRRVLALAGLGGAAVAALAVAADLAGLTGGPVLVPVLLFAFLLAYHGVRQARSTYLVDMAPAESRSVYTALSNTAIGVLLLVVGAFGAALASIGPATALAGLGAVSALGGLLALRLAEVERD